jgi:hypothetical protein
VAPGWRIASLLAGAPVGALAAFARVDHQLPLALPLAGAALGAFALLATVALLRYTRPGAAPRTARLAAAAGAGHAAWPALAAVALAWPPGPGWLALGVIAALVLALWRAARSDDGTTAWGPVRGAAIGVVAGAAACVALAALLALAAGSGPVYAPGRAEAVYDADARVPTRALPVCGRGTPQLDVLLERGARPRLSQAGDVVWFDARDDAGARQVERLRLSDGAVVCWTCDEPGDNRRAVPGGGGLLFETTRHASWRAPSNTEIHWIDTRGDAPRQPSRRLTYAPGPDDHALFAPGAPVVVWSRRRAGYEVVSAPIERAHGGMSLGSASTLARGGAAWLAPIDWSPDAHALVLLRGNRFAASAASVDFATGAQRSLAANAVPGGVAFSADGGFVLVAERGGSGTLLRAGGATAELSPIALPELAWGTPTGATLAPDGRSAVIGQRRADGGERLARVALGCL